jgi:hypothetical protein
MVSVRASTHETTEMVIDGLHPNEAMQFSFENDFVASDMDLMTWVSLYRHPMQSGRGSSHDPSALVSPDCPGHGETGTIR